MSWKYWVECQILSRLASTRPKFNGYHGRVSKEQYANICVKLVQNKVDHRTKSIHKGFLYRKHSLTFNKILSFGMGTKENLMSIVFKWRASKRAKAKTQNAHSFPNKSFSVFSEFLEFFCFSDFSPGFVTTFSALSGLY